MVKHYFMWNYIIIKRLLRTPYFWTFLALLLLLPIFVKNEIEKHGVGVRVLIMSETDTSADSNNKNNHYKNTEHAQTMSETLIDSLTVVGDSVISFEVWNESEELMREQIATGYAQAGYIIPDDLTERILDYREKRTPILTAVRSESEVSVRVIDEIVFGKLYDLYAESIAQDYAFSMDGREDSSRRDFIHGQYEKYSDAEAPFLFQHTDGSVFSEFQYGDDNLTALLPLRGLITVLVVLMALSGGVYWYRDAGRGVFMQLGRRGKELVHLSYIIIPTLVAVLVGLLTDLILIPADPLHELFAMLLLVVILIPAVYLIQKIVRSVYIYMALIPVIIVCNLIGGVLFT